MPYFLRPLGRWRANLRTCCLRAGNPWSEITFLIAFQVGFGRRLISFSPKVEKKPSTSAQSENQEHSAAAPTEPTLGDFKKQLFQSRLQALSYLSLPKGEKQPSAGAQSANQESPEADLYIPPSLIDPTFIPSLAKLAEQMVQAGYQQQCAKIYGEARALALESSLKNLGVEKLSKTQVQDSIIGDWIHIMRISVKLLFVGERLLCNQVFEWNQSLADMCFAEITENSLAMLLSFGEAMAMGEMSPFLLLDMYEIIGELQAEIDTIFVGESCSQMHESTLSLRKCLVQNLQKAFIHLEEATENDTSKLENDGTVHLLTIDVIHILMCLFGYRSTFEQLFQEVIREDGTCSDLTAVIMSVMEALRKNLDARAKEYKDLALMHIFLMNNNNYIVLSVSRSQEYKDLLGEDWIQRHQRIALQNADDYIRLAWSELLQCLSIQGSSSSDPSTSVVKERLKLFNMLLEEIRQKQCCWLVRDGELRKSLRLGIAKILLPAYSSFLLHFGKSSGKYIMHTPEQLEQLFGDLFAGKQKLPPGPGYSWLVNGISKMMQFLSNEDHSPERKVVAERKPEKIKKERKPEGKGYAVSDPIGGVTFILTD